ncbi:MAG: cupin domain-containing protein [Prochlorococcaceae cyanobacterium ETNP18_MAG_17]|jgi:hypothetical protein|nr:cupin domain-containing protein [Prochlorococcaceae cyanobacterium ETNP18_MAG_17]
MIAPTIDYWRVWTDSEGISHQSKQKLTDHQLKKFTEGASAIWVGNQYSGESSLITLVLPSGFVGEWHENPAPQWIIPLSGRWSVETMDGQVVEMGPGELSFGGDQGTREKDGQRGHRSWSVGSDAAVLMLLQVDESPKWNSAVNSP